MQQRVRFIVVLHVNVLRHLLEFRTDNYLNEVTDGCGVVDSSYNIML